MASKHEIPTCESWSVAPFTRFVYAPTGAPERDALRKRGEPMATYWRNGVKIAEQWRVVE